MGRPVLSVVVVVFDMVREAPRTLRTLSPACQADIGAGDYEVIVVDALAMLTGETAAAPPSDVERLETELATARAALEAVTSSRSWRYTAMARRLRGALGR